MCCLIHTLFFGSKTFSELIHIPENLGKTQEGQGKVTAGAGCGVQGILESGGCCAQPSCSQVWCVSPSAPEHLLLPPAFTPKPISNLPDEISTHEIQPPQQSQGFPSPPGALCHLTGVFSCLRCYFFSSFFPQGEFNRSRDHPLWSRNGSIALVFHSGMLGGCLSNTLLLKT